MQACGATRLLAMEGAGSHGYGRWRCSGLQFGSWDRRRNELFRSQGQALCCDYVIQSLNIEFLRPLHSKHLLNATDAENSEMLLNASVAFKRD